MSASDPQPPAVSGLTDLIESWRRSRDVERKTAAQQLVFNTRESELLETSADTYDSCADELEPLAAAVDDAVARLTARLGTHKDCQAQAEAVDRANAEVTRLREERDRETDLRRRAEALERMAREEMETLAKQVPFINEFDDMQREVASLRATLAATEEPWQKLDAMISVLEEGIENEEFGRALNRAGAAVLGKTFDDGNETPMPFTRCFKADVDFMREQLAALRASSADTET